jgi:HEAT repeat protein
MTIEELREGLSDRDAEVRRRAVLALEHEASEEVGGLLLSALGDEDWRVRKEAVQVGIQRASELVLIDALVAAICQGDNVGLRNASLDVLQGVGDEAARALVGALPQVPEHARKFVVEALGESGGPVVVAELSRAALSNDANVASEAIEALARIGGPDAERVMRARLTAADPFLRMAALDALNRCEAEVSWEELEPLLNDRLLRRVVVTALGRMGRAEAAAPLFAALEEPVLHVAAAAAIAISRLSASSRVARGAVEQELAHVSDRARASLRSVLRTVSDPEPQRAAAELLAQARDVESLSTLVAHLATDAPLPRMVEALRGWGLDAIDPLLTLFESLGSPKERSVALELAADLAFGADLNSTTARARVLSVLRTALHDFETSVRGVAARCLGEWGDAADAGTLAEQAVSNDGDVARAAVRALESLGKRSPEAVERALAQVSEEGTHGVALATVTAGIGGKGSLERLQRLMSSDHAEVRRASVIGLGKVGGSRAKGLLAIGLADEDPDVQIVAAQALGRFRDDQGGAPVDELLLALQSELAHVRAAVARALGESGSPLAVDPLRDLLRDPESGVAVAAVEALGLLGPNGLFDRLEPALLHRDSEVVKAALRALSEWRDPSALEALTSALSHGAWDVRQLSAELIGELGDRGALAAVSAQLSRENDDLVRLALSDAFARIGREG